MKKNRNSSITLINSIFSPIIGVITTCIFVSTATDWSIKNIVFVAILLYMISVVSSILKWFTTTFYLENNVLHYNTGILIKKESKIPLDNILAVDLVENLKQRIFGLKMLKVDRGATDNIEDIQIVLKSRQAMQLRKELLRKEVEEINDDKDTIYDLDIKDLFLFTITRNKSFDLFITSIGFIIFIFSKINIDNALTNINSPIIILLITLAFLLLVNVITVLKVGSRYFNYKIKQYDNLLEISSGFVERKVYSLDTEKVFAVKTRQSILQRMNNKVTVSVSTFGYQDDDLEEAVVFPSIDKNEVHDVLTKIFPKFIYKDDLYKIHKKYKLKYKHYEFGYNPEVLYLRGGILNKKTNSILIESIEEVYSKQSYFQRKYNIYKLKIGYKGKKMGDLVKLKGVYKNHIHIITEFVLVNE